MPARSVAQVEELRAKQVASTTTYLQAVTSSAVNSVKKGRR